MKQTIKIQNLKCGGCAHTIKTKLEDLLGVNTVEVMVVYNEVIINSDSENILSTVKQKLKLLGYPEETEENTIVTKAKSFVSCATGKFSKP